jgi:hypothetical protein
VKAKEIFRIGLAANNVSNLELPVR